MMRKPLSHVFLWGGKLYSKWISTDVKFVLKDPMAWWDCTSILFLVCSQSCSEEKYCSSVHSLLCDSFGDEVTSQAGSTKGLDMQGLIFVYSDTWRSLRSPVKQQCGPMWRVRHCTMRSSMAGRLSLSKLLRNV